jgi:sjoegren syndrome nuclear autoantigen 1
LKEQRLQVEKEIQDDLIEKSKIERQIAVLTERLTQVNSTFSLGSLSSQIENRGRYDRTIQETEGAYIKILESSQTLLHVMKRESLNLAKKSKF